jgi:hypothetical protein
MKELNDIKNTCFVCGKKVMAENSFLNQKVYLSVCETCKGTENEKNAVAEQLDSLADGFVCGCI